MILKRNPGSKKIFFSFSFPARIERTLKSKYLTNRILCTLFDAILWAVDVETHICNNRFIGNYYLRVSNDFWNKCEKKIKNYILEPKC